MFSAQRTPVFFNQFGDFSGYSPEKLYPFGFFQVDNRSQVQLSGGNVGMVDTFQSVTCHDFFKISNIAGQDLWVNGGVFYQ